MIDIGIRKMRVKSPFQAGGLAATPHVSLGVSRDGMPKAVRGAWCVTHLRSGLNLGGWIGDKKTAIRLTKALSWLVDWSQTSAQLAYLKVTGGVGDVVSGIISELRTDW